MNLLSPVSEIMTTKLITVNPKDDLGKVKKIFDENKIHHIPVVRYKEIVGLISKSDFFFFLKGSNGAQSNQIEEGQLKGHLAEKIMTKGLAKLESTDRISVALEVFKENLFHAIPVVDENELVGIITTYDIIASLAEKRLTV